MNRIILIGNGFDLAHGLKTSYQNFIDSIIENLYYETKRRAGINTTLDIEIIVDPIDLYKDDYFNIDYFKRLLTSKPYKGIVYKNKFLEKLIYNRTVNNWCDIETLFYDELNLLLNNEKTTDKEIKKFNSDFQRIINLLEEYLLIIVKSESSIEKHIQLRISKLLNSNYDLNDLSVEYLNQSPGYSKELGTSLEFIQRGNDENIINRCLILDFNYTQTILPYIEKMTDLTYINIHGVLKSETNPIIFGFGDELDENYLKIEKSRLDGVLEYIKSINYLKTSNYRNVLNFLELNNFQVYTWGHSCGLTDRTLLNHIFEHNNCTSIKPFYYQWFDENNETYSNNYIEVVSNIARNFKDKNKLRDRVVDFSRCEPLIK